MRAVASARPGATAADIIEVAPGPDLADLAKAVGHVRRPGRGGTVPLTAPTS